MERKNTHAQGYFSEVYHGRVKTGRTIQINLSSVVYCTQACLQNFVCKSVNFNEDEKLCELLSGDRVNGNTSYEYDFNWQYYDTGKYC